MKKVQISDTEVRLIVILLSIIFLALAYFFGLNKGLQNAQLINGECDTIQAEIDSLNDMIARKKAIEEETVAMRQAIVDIVAKYPVARPTEKVIYEIQKIEDMTEAHFDTVSFGMDQPLVPAENGVMGFKNVITLNYDCDYDNMKVLFDYVKDNTSERMNISNISMDYDMETGKITGKMELNLYYLTGTDRAYEEIPEMKFGIGMDNVFLGMPHSVEHPTTTLEIEGSEPKKNVVTEDTDADTEDTDADTEDASDSEETEE